MANSPKQRNFVQQLGRNLAVGLGLRPNSFSGMMGRFSEAGLTAEDLIEMSPDRKAYVASEAKRAVLGSAEEGFAAFVMEEFGVEPTAEELRIFMQIVTRRQGLAERADKYNKTAAALVTNARAAAHQPIDALNERFAALEARLRAADDRAAVQAEGIGAVLENQDRVGSSRVDLQACKLEYSIVSPK